MLRAAVADERGSAEASELLADLMASGIEPIAPDVFPYEVGNALRHLRASPEERIVTLLRACSVPTLLRPTLAARRAALELALASKVSYYDACYVVAAREHDASLWTEDVELLKKFPDVAVSTDSLRASRSRKPPE